MKKILIPMLALSLIACEKQDGNSTSDPNQMHFNLQLPGAATKVTTNNFEVGDNVGLYVTEYDGEVASPLQISGNYVSNVILTYDGSDWTPLSKVSWTDNKMDVYAYYPYRPGIGSIEEDCFSVADDQSIEGTNSELGGYEASDLLWAKAAGVLKSSENPDPVSLIFKHACSKVVIRLVKGPDFVGSFPEDATMLIHNTVIDGLVDYATGSVSKDLYGVPESITCHKVPNPVDPDCPEYEAIVIPQRVESRRPFIEYIAGKTSYLVEDSFNFRPGMCYIYTLTVNASPEQTIINIGGTIDNWE